MRSWGIVFLCCVFVNAAVAEEGVLTRAARSFLKPQSFPTVFSDASFETRMRVLAQGYEPWETEYDSNGRCISGCAYSTMDIDEDLRRMQQQTQTAVAELQSQGALPLSVSQQGQVVPPKPTQGHVSLGQGVESVQSAQTSQTAQVVQNILPGVQQMFQGQTNTGVSSNENLTPQFQYLSHTENSIPLRNLRADVDYASIQAKTTYDDWFQGWPIGWPVKGRPKITSPFGRRTHPVTGNQQNHTGVDLAVASGTDVFSPANGKVVSVWTDGTCGRGIKISHSSGYETLYCHLDKQLVLQNQQVKKGDLIAKSGNSGRSTGSHLHYAIKKDGIYIDPAELMQ